MTIPAYIIIFVIPILLIHNTVRLFFKKHKTKIILFLPFYLPLLTLPILANIGWQLLLRNRVYYEWDNVGILYHFIGYERPGLGLSNWILPGWEFGLFIVWLLSTILIYAITLIYSYWKSKNKEDRFVYNKINTVTISILSVITLVFALGHYINL